MKIRLITTQLLILMSMSILLFGQNYKEIKEKLNMIKGDVTKIVITSDDGEVVFEGDEANRLFKKMKSRKLHKQMRWISKDGEDIDLDSTSSNVMIFKSGHGGKHIIREFKKGDNVMIFKDDDIDDLDIIKDGKIIKVNVEELDGEKKVTVTTKENGEEKVETFEGKEAEEYLEKMEKEDDMVIEVEVDTDSPDNVWIHKDGDGNNIDKKVEVEIEDGEKKVTVTTNEDGKEKVEIYEGEEADEYLKNESGDKHLKFHELKNGKKVKKIIIKEIEQEK